MLRVIILFISIFSLFTLRAQNKDIENLFLNRLDSMSSYNKTIISNFEQVKVIKGLKGKIVSKGEFFYDNSGSMSLIYEVPKGDKVVMSGENFTIITSGKKIESSASENPMMAQISYMMQACMSGEITKLGSGWLMTIEEQEGGYKVVITPNDRRIKRYVENMQMIFNQSDMTLNELQINEKKGGYTQYIFKDKRVNVEIDSSVFNI